MSNSQSSLELFAIALYEKGFLRGNGDEINDLLEEHKEIHKEEIKAAFRIGDKFASDYFGGDLDEDEQYYIETFNTKEK